MGAARGRLLWAAPAALVGLFSAAVTPAMTAPLAVEVLPTQALGAARVRAVAVADSGVAWVVSAAGLVRLEGGIPQAFDSTGTTLLPDARISALMVPAASPQRLWIGTYGGLARREPGGWRHWRRREGLPDDRVTALVDDGAGGAWVGTWHGLARVRADTVAGVAGLPLAPVAAIQVDAAGLVRVGFDDGGGLWRLATDDGPATRIAGPRQLSVRALARGGSGRLWCASADHGLWRLAGDVLQPGPSLPTPILSLGPGQGDTLWVGTGRGLVAVAGDPPTTSDATAVPARAVPSLRTEATDLWVGTWDRGLWRRRRGTWQPAGVTARRIDAVAATGRLQVAGDDSLWGYSEGAWSAPVCTGEATCLASTATAVWVGTRTEGLLRLHDGEATRFHPDHHLPAVPVHDLALAPSGLWLATDAGPVRYDGEQFQPLPRADGTPVGAVQVVTAAGDDVWLGGAEGVFRWHRGALSRRVAASDLPGRITAVAPMPEGTAWIGTAEAAVLVGAQGSSLRRIEATASLPKVAVRGIAVDAGDRVWIAASGGLLAVDADSVHSFTAAEGLKASLLTGVAVDAEGGVWVGGLSGGLSRYEGPAHGFRAVGPEAGMPSSLVWDVTVDGAGDVWASTDKGLVRIRAADIAALPRPPPPPRRSAWPWLVGAGVAAVIAWGARRRRRAT